MNLLCKYMNRSLLWNFVCLKKYLMVILPILSIGTFVNAQSCRIISITKSADHSKDFAKTGFCYDINRFEGDYLEVQFYTARVINKTPGFYDAVSYSNGVLNFYDGYKYPMYKDSVFINKKTKKSKVIRLMQSQSIEINQREPYEKRFYILAGIKTLPLEIQYNGQSLCSCSSNVLKFELYQSDTINVINANGLKAGVWLEFFNTGKVMKKRIYKNGNLLGGFIYDQSGKITHRIEASDFETAIPVE